MKKLVFEKCPSTGKSRPIFICSQEMIDKLKNLGYTTPTLITGYGMFYYACDRDPTDTESDIYTGYPDFLITWWNQTSGQIWWCNNNTTTPLQWQSTRIGMSRDYVMRVSPAFSTSYQPNIMLDTLVTAIVSLTSALLTSSEVNAQIDAGNGFLTRETAGLSGLVGTSIATLSFLVPAGASYQLIDVNSNATLVSLHELTC